MGCLEPGKTFYGRGNGESKMQRHKGRNTPGSSRSSREAGVVGAEWEQVGGGAGKEARGLGARKASVVPSAVGRREGVEPRSDMIDI